jgi:hypothetical protein
MSIVGNSYFDDIAPATKYKIENSDITEDHNHHTVLPQKIKMGPIEKYSKTVIYYIFLRQLILLADFGSLV